MPAKAIDLDGQYYIERYRVFKLGKLEVLLHRYLGSDGDSEVHDHPHYWCLGIPLRGGYLEERVVGFDPDSPHGWYSKFIKVRPWRWNFVSAMRWHRIAVVEPGTWTLFIRWNRFKGWSFARKAWAYSDPGKSEIKFVQPYESTGDDWVVGALKGAEFRKARGTE